MKPVSQKPIKSMTPRSLDVGTGPEPDWKQQPEDDYRKSRLTTMFNWYNYYYGKKEARDCIIDWLSRNGRTAEAKDFARVPENAVTRMGIGWLCRANLLGLQLAESELATINSAIADYIEAHRRVKAVIETAELTIAKPNIQDRLREKLIEAAGELEGMYDEMIRSGAKMSANYKPVSLFRSMNVAPQMINEIATQWKGRLSELEEVAKGKDSDLVEGYGQFGKLQIRNLIKFAETVINDCGAYIQIKKVERKPRAKKAVPVEKIVSKFKHLRTSADPKLQGEPATKLVGASEAWLYDTAKRKLIYVVADTHVGSLTVKGSSVIGFDPATTVQKTLRKPAEQLKSITSVGKPAARKAFKEIKATEVKWNGRSNEHLLILKVY